MTATTIKNDFLDHVRKKKDELVEDKREAEAFLKGIELIKQQRRLKRSMNRNEDNYNVEDVNHVKKNKHCHLKYNTQLEYNYVVNNCYW